MAGGLISYGDALKAFRRGVHQFPFEWRAIVVCAGMPQLKYAFDEACRVLDAGSLSLEKVNPATAMINTEKGGELRFMTVDSLPQRLEGLEAPQFIVISEVSEEIYEHLRLRNRHGHIDQKYCRIDQATL